MNLTTLQKAAEEFEAEANYHDTEAARCRRIASDLRATIERESKNQERVVSSKASAASAPVPSSQDKSVYVLAVEILQENLLPMHVDNLVPLINQRRAAATSRAAVESQLARAIKTKRGGVVRVSPGTFTVQKS